MNKLQPKTGVFLFALLILANPGASFAADAYDSCGGDNVIAGRITGAKNEKKEWKCRGYVGNEKIYESEHGHRIDTCTDTGGTYYPHAQLAFDNWLVAHKSGAPDEKVKMVYYFGERSDCMPIKGSEINRSFNDAKGGKAGNAAVATMKCRLYVGDSVVYTTDKQHSYKDCSDSNGTFFKHARNAALNSFFKSNCADTAKLDGSNLHTEVCKTAQKTYKYYFGVPSDGYPIQEFVFDVSNAGTKDLRVIK